MPVIIDSADFDRWLSAVEPPADLLKPYPAAPVDFEGAPGSRRGPSA
jgi:putative SOS response-associated peptidase YedK